jgi:hypothetical protein
MGEQDLSTEARCLLLEAPKRRAPGECQRGYCAKSCQESHETILHRSILQRSLDLPALEGHFRCHARYLLAASVSAGNTKTDLTRKSVGCTTRSASTLSAQFRWRHQRVRAFMDAQYVSTSAGPDYREPGLHRSIRNPTYAHQSTRPHLLRSSRIGRVDRPAAAATGPRSWVAPRRVAREARTRSARTARQQQRVDFAPCRS